MFFYFKMNFWTFISWKLVLYENWLYKSTGICIYIPDIEVRHRRCDLFMVTYPLARPTTSFFSSQSCPGAYNPLSSTELLSPLVRNLTFPSSLKKKKNCVMLIFVLVWTWFDLDKNIHRLFPLQTSDLKKQFFNAIHFRW